MGVTRQQINFVRVPNQVTLSTNNLNDYVVTSRYSDNCICYPIYTIFPSASTLSKTGCPNHYCKASSMRDKETCESRGRELPLAQDLHGHNRVVKMVAEVTGKREKKWPGCGHGFKFLAALDQQAVKIVEGKMDRPFCADMWAWRETHDGRKRDGLKRGGVGPRVMAKQAMAMQEGLDPMNMLCWRY